MGVVAARSEATQSAGAHKGRTGFFRIAAGMADGMTNHRQEKPVRIQRKRTKGWRMPPNTVSVTRPGRWGNPWRVGLIACSCRSAGECTHNSFRCETPQQAADTFRTWAVDAIANGNGRMRRDLEQLRGKDLACYCSLDQPCHADVLLEIANS